MPVFVGRNGRFVLGLACCAEVRTSVRFASQRSDRKFWLGRFAVKSFAINLLVIICFIAGASASGQSTPDTPQAHVAAAKAAARNEYVGLFDRLCVEPRPSAVPRQQTQPRAAPER